MHAKNVTPGLVMRLRSKVRAFFKGCGEVTNVRWLKDSAGKFRGVAFVTFASTEHVDKAVERGGECMGTRPIRVDYQHYYK